MAMRYCKDCELYECCMRTPLGGCQEFDNVAPKAPEPIPQKEVWKSLYDHLDWDWEKFRREAAKDILAGWYSNPDSNDRSIEQLAQMAIEQVDELIRQLKLKVVKDDKRETTESL